MPDIPLLSVVVPCFNEERTLAEIIQRITFVDLPLEVIVVDDGSHDNSRAILQSICVNDPRIKAFFHEKNKGKGAALATGFKHATGAFVIVQDADLEYDPLDYYRMLEPALTRGADAVFGSRFAGNDAHRVLYFWHQVANQFLTLMSNMTTNLNLTDMEVCYKLFRREVIQRIEIQEQRFGFEPEITAKLAKHDCKIYEVGVSYNGRTYAEGKKIGIKDALRALYCIFRYGLLSSRKPKIPQVPLPNCYKDFATHLMRSRQNREAAPFREIHG